MAEIDTRVANVPRAAAGSNTTLLIVAVVMALFVVVLTNVYITLVRREVEDQGIVVYRLKRDVTPGYKIREQDLEQVRIPKAFAEYGSEYIKPADLPNQLGRAVLSGAKQGSPFTTQLFTKDSQQLDFQIAEGMRGCPLPISSRTAPGILRPGMYIDLYATFPMPGQLPKTLAVMERVKVVAVGSVTEGDESDRRISYSTVTVEVDPEAAKALLAISKFIGREGFDPLVRQPRDTSGLTGINPEVLKLVGLE